MELENLKVFHSSYNIAHEISENKVQPDSVKVFHSNITRGKRTSDNNLYELIDVAPAAPKWEIKKKENSFCVFEPKSDKFYIPKKRSKNIKVKTVGNVRSELEKEVYGYLHADLEKQQNILLKKITSGSAKDQSTKILAKKIIKSDNPISRSAWQMLMNINPDDQPNSIQFVLWNGKRIRVNGSKGGKNKFLCNHDLGTRKTITHSKPKFKHCSLKKIGLLRNSLSVNFKPGPLTKKISLDDSYQKYNVGVTELINLPKPCLEIKPTLGVPVEPTVVNFLNNYRNVDGRICQKWAEFSVSVLGSSKSTEKNQNNDCRPIKFELNYKANQSRILMRHDIHIQFNDSKIATHTNTEKRCEDDTLVIQSVVNDILNSVDINLLQDKIYTGVDDVRDLIPDDSSINNNLCTTKEKPKRKLNELDRLDVTIIRIPEGLEDEKNENCQKSFCSLGCICNSLRCDYKLKQHCGHVECMFECKCDFTKYKASYSFDGLLPGLLNLNENINSKLAKEEKKFHQTVVVTRDKSVLLKTEKRNWKASKRYSEFFSNMNLRTDVKTESQLSIVDVKLNCENVEPWCMVHCLYKCFCKGKFTNTSILDKPASIPEKLTSIPDKLTSMPDVLEPTTKDVPTIELDNMEFDTRSKKHCKLETSKTKLKKEEILDETSICARVEPYTGRKYKDSYYQNTHKKILEMERNDSNLHKKMISIINRNDENHPDAIESNSCPSPSISSTSVTNKKDLTNTDTVLHSNKILDTTKDKHENIESSESQPSVKHIINCDPKSGSFKDKLMAWVEIGYKQYKQRFKQGNVKLFLERPRRGKFALYPSEFILDRYRERKNLFLITKQQPMRILMAVDVKHPFFDNCLNIDDIRFADLHKYPATIKNLLTNASDLQNTFFIMHGLSLCWEIVGSVVKVSENSDDSLNDTNSQESNESSKSVNSNTEDNLLLSFSRDNELENTVTSPEALSVEDSMDKDDIVMFNCEEHQKNIVADLDCDISKWFVMTIENDFSEIRFYERGFFVKYEAIIKAINVARMSSKAVRLSAPKCTDKNSATPFGIYAIPNTKEYCVYIGPYEKDESLGIETVKSFKSAQKSKGVWITTKKIDNLKVIKSPLAFMPPANDLHISKIVPVENDITNETAVENLDVCKDPGPNAGNRLIKIGKPIKINKTNGFYHLAFKNHTNVTVNSSQYKNQSSRYVTHTATSSTVNQPLIHPSSTSKSNVVVASTSQRYLLNSENKKPVAEIAPQIKIISVYSEADSETSKMQDSKRPEGGMFILKPEEINKKLMLSQSAQNNIQGSRTVNFTQTRMSSDIDSDVINEDIEKFLATYEVCNPPNADVDMIADEDTNKESIKYQEVFIECLNVDNLGWIKGKRDSMGKLSFEFPGFKFTDFYTEEEAFSKINQVLSRKIYIPKTLQPKWHVVETVQTLKSKYTINPDSFGSDFVLTKRGPRHKREIIKSSKQSVSEVGRNIYISTLEEQSQLLEKEGDKLLQQFKEKGEAWRSLYKISNDQQTLLTERIKKVTNPDSPG